MWVALTYVAFVVFSAQHVLGFNLIILHTNDVHAHIEEMNKYTSECKEEDKVKDRCYGGVARRLTKVKEIRDKYKDDVILIDAGDQYQGSLWYNIYKGGEAALFMNKLQYDVMTFGNHEFDDGIAGLVPFLDNITFPVVSCNLDASREPRLNGRFNKSTVLTIKGQKIGVIGYITEETSTISNPGSTVSFKPAPTAIQGEIDKLKRKGVNIIIGLGHYGYGRDQKLATAVDGLDVIVGGHSHTFIYSGKPPSNDKPAGEYPTVITNNGRNVLVVQDFWAGKYLGFLNVTFNADGDVESWNGDPILLDNSTLPDPELEAIIAPMKILVEKEKTKIVGFSSVFLEGDRSVCRTQECNLGNLIADGMVSFHAARHSGNNSWSDKPIAIMNSGGIRSPIGQGNISKGDVLTTLPFGNTVDVITIKGKYIRQAFEHSVAHYDLVDSSGAFLQVSGIKVTYDLCKPSGSRVVSLYTRCGNCWIPTYKPLNDNKVYTVIALNFLINGGDGYSVVTDNLIKHIEYNSLDSNVFIRYLQNHSPIIKGVEGRITVLNECVNDSNRILYNYFLTFLCMVAFYVPSTL